MGAGRERSFGREGPAASGPRDGGGAREIACRRLARDAETFPELAIEPLDTSGLEARDAALASTIQRECARRWLTLECLIGHALDRPVATIEPGVRAALLAGAAQLVLLDRVPPHAAIDESVEWAKRNVRPKAGGLVNAVLRRVSRLVGERAEAWDASSRRQVPRSDGTAVVLDEDVLPGDELERIAAAASVPIKLVRKWRDAFGDEVARALAIHGLCDAPIVLNLAHAEAPVDAALVGPHGSEGSGVFLGTRAELGELLGARSDIWVQDAAACEAVRLAGDVAPRVVVDSCAGLGTKTRQLSRVFPDAEIVASDVDGRRVSELRRVFAGGGNVRVVEYAALADEVGGRAGLVLLDVPCSNTGVLPRRPEARYRVSRRQQDRLIKIQRQAARDGAALLGDGGRLLYSTCSIEREENEAQSEWAGRDLGLRVVRTARHMPGGAPSDPPSRYRDGAFACLLER